MIEKVLFAAAGLCGAAGVALAALASHGGDDGLMIAATFLLVHAPALMVLATRKAKVAGAVLVVGLVVFAGDLAARSLLGERLFAFAAPIGGTLLIVGWLLAAASAFFSPRE